MFVIPSYMLKNYNLDTFELGSVIYEPEAEKLYIVFEPGKLSLLDMDISAEEFKELIAAGGLIELNTSVDAPTGFTVTADTTIVNNGTLSISQDTEGDGVFKVTGGTLTLEGSGVINGVGNNIWNMAIWGDRKG